MTTLNLFLSDKKYKRFLTIGRSFLDGRFKTCEVHGVMNERCGCKKRYRDMVIAYKQLMNVIEDVMEIVNLLNFCVNRT